MRRPHPPERDGGSVLMLVPAAVLVLVVLGAIAVDSAIVFLAHRDLANRTAAAANDIAGFALADEALFGAGSVVLSQERATDHVDRVIDGAPLPGGLERMDGTARVDGAQVEVAAEAEVRHFFALALPGAKRTTVVRAVSTATAVTP